MGRIIAIANQKGGVGKTTTAINLSAFLAEKGKKVLAADLDPQGNLTSGLGIDKNGQKNTAYEMLIDKCAPEEAVLKDVYENLDVISSNVNLSGCEVELMDRDRREFILKSKLDEIKDGYDVILIDCPPSLNILTINALTAADSVLIPIQCEYYALEGLGELLNTVDLERERLNDRLEIEGIVFTMYDARTNLSAQVVQNVKENLNVPVFETKIPRNVRLAEAPSYGIPINLYDSRSTGAVSYEQLADELIRKLS
ncbi:MAG: ParA family protein [Lachnospiraceae bacterium]